MFSKNLATNLLVILASYGICFAANANDLTIVNNTKQDSTAIINGGACSSSLPDGKGITRAGQTNTLPSNLIFLACGFSKDCEAVVYMSASCSSNGKYPAVATASFNLDTGLKEIKITDPHYQIQIDSANKFKIEINGGY